MRQLWGITRERQLAAQERLAAWGIAHLASELAATTADGAVGAVMLVESIDDLTARGVDERKLLSKLRGDPDVWPTWAEIRAAGLLARHTTSDAQLLVEPGRSAGRHADFAFVYSGQGRHSMEFKAIGLSDQEAAFANAMAPLLPGLLPRFGVLTMHLHDTSTSITMNRAERRFHRLQAERLAKNLHPVARRIAASVIVGHGTEETYIRRLTSRFREALAQLPSEDECWVAFHWSNGAPISMVRRALAEIDVPDHIAGIVLAGSVAIPGRLDNYVVIGPAPFDTENGEELWYSDSTVEDAQTVFGLVDASAGVRPTYIRVPWEERREDFLLRTGNRRIFPYNVVLSPDPPDLVLPRDAQVKSQDVV